MESQAHRDIAKLVRRQRADARLTQRELARRCGMNATTIARLESDTWTGCTLSTLMAVAEGLGLKLAIDMVAE